MKKEIKQSMLNDSESTGTTFHCVSESSEATETLGCKLGELIFTPMTILLTAELGGGKTTWVRGLAKGMGVPDDYAVTSPTYALIHEYPARLPLYHVDLYRIGDPEEVYDIGLDEILAGDCVVAVEWPEGLPEYPAECIDVEIVMLGDETRDIRMNAVGDTAVDLLRRLNDSMAHI